MTRFVYGERGGSRARALLAMTFAAAVLAGCSGTGSVQAPSTPSRPATGEWLGREGVQDAIALLNRGEAEEARRRLMTVLQRDPADGIARQLISQIDGDPRQVLGEQSYAYTLREGETLSMIAQRALGNPMMFYILARYNNIAVPESVQPGQVIQVPGRRPAARPERRRPSPSHTPERAEPAPPPAAEPAPARPASNPALASRLRGQGLSALNAGAVDRAVALLRQALAADPDNGAVRRDLDRALRVQRTVRSRR